MAAAILALDNAWMAGRRDLEQNAEALIANASDKLRAIIKEHTS